ncbi:MAG TPA: chemotaxis protein CheA [Usitatibacter sp.]|nr:chemotaxis protein CheA [Usitatibacter sp.]
MAIDLSRFADSFYDEAGDHLVTMESLLLAVGTRRPDDESLNAIFRAAHSIKGGALAFGHVALGEFTHDLESAFDRIRKGALDLSKGLVGVFLRSVDAVREHVIALRQGKSPDLSTLEAVRKELRSSVAIADRVREGLDEPIPVPAHHVELALGAAEFPVRATVDVLLAELAALGTLRELVVDFEPGRGGFISFALECSARIEQTRDSLRLFVADESIRKCHAGGLAGGELEIFDAPAAASADSFGFFAPEAAAPSAALSDSDSVRINIARMDDLVNLVGELVITQAMISRAAQTRGPALDDAIAELERNTRELQRSVLSIRMLPIRHVTSRIPRLARDVAERVEKEVDLVLEGEDTELDKGLIEKIADPLMHLVRNAIDHGIESVRARALAGKPAHGRVAVRARHEGGKVVISVADDGAGLDRAAIVAKAREAGIPFDESAADDKIWPLIFRPGFSTAACVTEVSGRGVGMDVVQRNVTSLGGTIDIESAAGRGATFTLRLPLTLAIIEGMSIVANGESYVVPLAAVAKSLRDEAAARCIMASRQVLAFEGEFIPVVSLAALFDPKIAPRAAGGVHVVLEVDGKLAALHVDELLGLHQTVVKGLEDNYRRVDGVSGATILADGRVALILDAQRIIERAAGIEARRS